ncbi:hypothetical protein [Ekhidna sp. To15]|uniref:hypothetical protein n=1 Tax=Ekhidna sp. To15 TaxID=3395267 RepID=UPI003F51C22C
MKPFIRLYFSIILIFTVVGCTDGIGARYTLKRVLNNQSNYEVQLIHFFYEGSFDTLVHRSDSIVYEAYCVAVGGELQCSNPDYSFVLAQALEDSVYIIFNNERIIKFIESEFGPCCNKNILEMETQQGYKVSGEGTSLRTYTYEITNEDYEMAEPY